MLKRYEQFSSAITGIYLHIQKIQRGVMAQYGLKGSQTQCLIELYNHPKGITFTDLCDVCGKDKAAVSRAITSMEEMGLIQRNKNERGTSYRASLTLTESGLKAASLICDEASKAAERASADLSGPQRQQFYRNLQMVATNLSKLYGDADDDED